MRLRLLLRVLSALIGFVGLSLLIPFFISLGYGEEDAGAFLLAALCTIIPAMALFFLTRIYFKAPPTGRAKRDLGHREAFLVTALGWVLAGIIGALPFYFYAHRTVDWFDGKPTAEIMSSPLALHGDCTKANAGGTGAEFCSFTNCLFESISGFTTTGASILAQGLWSGPDRRDPRDLPHGLLFWRSFTHWLGGMGIILLGIAILPFLGVGGMQLFKTEVPGPVADKLAPRITDTAKLLWKVYVIFTMAETLLLMFGGMNLFEALCQSFGTMATGGYSTRAASITGFNSLYVEIVILVFMLIAGTNFSLHYLALKGRLSVYVKNTEFRFYGGLFLTVTLLSAFVLVSSGQYLDMGAALRYASFQTASILTTTGFATADFNAWAVLAPLAPFLLLVLMFIGGCAGSTGGGMKCIRIWLLLKQGYRELFRLIHPHAVTKVRMGNTVVPTGVLRSVSGFLFLHLIIFFFSVIAMSAMGLNFTDAFSSVAASLGNIGPGLGSVGPVANYNHIPETGKWLLMMLMVMGRLEIYTILILFIPEFWRR